MAAAPMPAGDTIQNRDITAGKGITASPMAARRIITGARTARLRQAEWRDGCSPLSGHPVRLDRLQAATALAAARERMRPIYWHSARIATTSAWPITNA